MYLGLSILMYSISSNKRPGPSNFRLPFFKKLVIKNTINSHFPIRTFEGIRLLERVVY
jgi:hypothetical protein